MSILIKGMEMPKGCYDCTLESVCGRWALHDAEWQKENRDDACPLIPVPPHGGLIDKKTVSENLAKVLNEKTPPFAYPDWNDAIVAMLATPVIIEAEEGE